jgi:7,8-didemethyl-8-hydroxy-5-deazariboflavin synthase CofH subunit
MHKWLSELGQLRWDEVAARASGEVRGALETVLASEDGGSLTPEQRLLLARTTGDNLLALAVAADELRRSLVGDTVTYVVNRNINFTNVCFVGCKFCAFSVGARDQTAYHLSLEDMARKTREARRRGATEVCIQGGLPRNLPPFYYRDILRAVKAAVPDMHAHAFSPMEVDYGVELTGMGIRDYFLMMKDAGLDTLPGTAAEILSDDVRQIVSRNKLSSARWREIVTTAHECGIRSTSTMMYGHVETAEHWVNHLQLLRSIQAGTGGFTEFVPLGFVHQNTLLFHEGLSRPGPTIDEHVRVHALSRVLLAGSIPNIQISWVKLTRETAQLCLHAGANDYGGTLMEENISRLAGATSGEYLSREQIEERVRAAGRVPAQRTTYYGRVAGEKGPSDCAHHGRWFGAAARA